MTLVPGFRITLNRAEKTAQGLEDGYKFGTEVSASSLQLLLK